MNGPQCHLTQRVVVAKFLSWQRSVITCVIEDNNFAVKSSSVLLSGIPVPLTEFLE